MTFSLPGRGDPPYSSMPCLRIAQEFRLPYGEVLHFHQWVEDQGKRMTSDQQAEAVKRLVSRYAGEDPREREEWVSLVHLITTAVEVFQDQKAGRRDLSGNWVAPHAGH